MELLWIIMKVPSYSFFLITPPPPHSHHPNHPTHMTTCPSTSPAGLWEAQFSSVQLLSRVPLFVIPRTAARQASLSITNSQSLIKLMSIESVMPSNHLILCHPLLLLPSIFSSIRGFSNELALCIKWLQSIESSPSASAFPMNIQVCFPLGLTGLISLQSKGLSRVFSNTTVKKHQFIIYNIYVYCC